MFMGILIVTRDNDVERQSHPLSIVLNNQIDAETVAADGRNATRKRHDLSKQLDPTATTGKKGIMREISTDSY
jgi:hypothetical protein